MPVLRGEVDNNVADSPDQRKIADKIVGECISDYVLDVKGNKEGMLNDIKKCFQYLEK